MFLTWRPDTVQVLKSDRDFSLHTFLTFVQKIRNIEHFVPTRIAVFPGLYKTSRKTTGKIEHFGHKNSGHRFQYPLSFAFLSYVIASIYSRNNFSFSVRSDCFLYPFRLLSYYEDRAKFATQNKRLYGARLLLSYLTRVYLLSMRWIYFSFVGQNNIFPKTNKAYFAPVPFCFSFYFFYLFVGARANCTR